MYIPAMKRLAAIATFLTVATSALVSSAQTSPQATQSADGETQDAQGSTEGGRYYYMEQQNRWYGWQQGIVDVITIPTVFFAGRAGKWGVGGVAAGAYVIGGPAFHIMHQRPQFAALSGISRLAIPGAALLIPAVLVSNVEDKYSKDTEMSAGLLIGGLLASALDLTLLSTDTVEIERRFDAHKGPTLAPHVAATGNSFMIGVQGFGW